MVHCVQTNDNREIIRHCTLAPAIVLLAVVPTAAELVRIGPVELFNRLEIVFRYIFGDLFTQYGSANAGSTIMKTGKDAGHL